MLVVTGRPREREPDMQATPVGGFAALVFDAYGTLFDVAALDASCGDVTDRPAELSRLWRTKQLEYAYIRSAIDRYADWGQITADALDYAAAAFSLRLDPGRRRDLLRAWLTLPPFPDAPPALARLANGGVRLAILSNGTRQMLAPLLRHAQLDSHFQAVLSSEDVQTFKPDPLIYTLATERFQSRAAELLFVTSNGFDVAGAKAFGMTVCRVDRARVPLDRLGEEPDVTVRDLGELAERVLGADTSL